MIRLISSVTQPFKKRNTGTTINTRVKNGLYMVGLNIFIHISIYSNIQIYILQYNHGGIQKKVMRLIRICFPLNIKVHSLKL